MRFTFVGKFPKLDEVNRNGTEEKAVPTAEGKGTDTAGAGRDAERLPPGRIKMGG